jgi:hypothetical protein
VIGAKLGSYEIRRQLGAGGMGAVYVAEHALLGRQAAVKVLLPELCKNPDVVARFFHEAKAATAIRHPSIVEVFDFGYMPDGAAYIVMELLEGESLSSRLRRVGRLPVPHAISMTRQIANALAAAHARKIVHRDLKPDNIHIVVDPEVAGGERIKLLDFGIAKLAVDLAATGIARTSTGMLMGTPIYMSPEQCRSAGQVDHRSDLYSLGCILHEMLTGAPPFMGEGAGDLIAKHIMVAPPPPSSLVAGVPPDVDALVARLLQKSPNDRLQSAADLAAACSHLVPSLTPISIPIPSPSSSSPIAAMPTPLATPLPIATPPPVASGTPAPAPAQLARVLAEPAAPIPVAPPAVTPIPPPPVAPPPYAPPPVAKTTPVQRPQQPPPANRPVPEALLAVRARHKRMYWYMGGGLVVVLGCIVYVLLTREDPFLKYMKKSKQSEADVNLRKLRIAIETKYFEDLKFPDAMPVTPSGTSPCCSGTSTTMGKCDPDPTLWRTGVWEQLYFSLDEPHYFRYEIARPDEDTVVLRAYGDLDCDHNDVVHEITGRKTSGNLDFDEVRVIGSD